jgi:hypothetical protein
MNKPTAEVHPGHKLTGPKEEEEDEEVYMKIIYAFNLSKAKRNLLYIRIRPYRAVKTFHHVSKNQIS